MCSAVATEAINVTAFSIVNGDANIILFFSLHFEYSAFSRTCNRYAW